VKLKKKSVKNSDKVNYLLHTNIIIIIIPLELTTRSVIKVRVNIYSVNTEGTLNACPPIEDEDSGQEALVCSTVSST